MCFYDTEPADVYDTSFPRARKPHTCYECSGEIPVGQRYEKINMLFDGKWHTYKMCRRCVWLHGEIERMEEDGGCYGIEASCPIGGLMAHVSEYGLSFDDAVPAEFQLV